MKFLYILKMSKYLILCIITVLCCNMQIYLLPIILFRWQPDSKFPYSQVRLPQEPDNKVEFAENMDVEVYSRSNPQEAFGWWKARIKVIFFPKICFAIYF